MKPNRTFLFILLLVVILSLLKFFYFPSSSQNETAAKQSGTLQVVADGIILKPEKLSNQVFASGTVYANQDVELKPEMAGKILQIAFKEGSHVSKGDLLVKINDADLQAQLKKIRLQLKLASDNESRQKKLLDINGISRQEYDGTLNELNSLKADEEFTEAQIAKTEIRAPFNGKIGLKNVSEGSYVTPQTIIASLQQLNPLKIDFSVPEKYADLVHVGDLIQFTVGESQKYYSGNVYAMEPGIHIATRSLHLRAYCKNISEDLLPGTFVKIQLTLKEIADALLVPSEAIIPDWRVKKIFVYRDGKAEPKNVATGLRTHTKVQIIEGLQAGDTVLTSGIMQLKPKMIVKLRLKQVHQ